MKNLGLFCLLLACFGFESCKKAKDIEAAKVLAETPIRVQCYKALYENDTIELKINTLKNEKITGDMIMSFVDMPKKNDKVVGEFRGDTLFADYSFIQGTEEKTTYKNPMAFLKRGDELILGNGKIESYLGASYFAKGVPIDFENVKYKFTSVDCME